MFSSPPQLLSGPDLLSEVLHNLPEALCPCCPSAPSAPPPPLGRLARSKAEHMVSAPPPPRNLSVSFLCRWKARRPSNTLLSVTPYLNHESIVSLWTLPWVCMLASFSTTHLPSPGCPRLLHSCTNCSSDQVSLWPDIRQRSLCPRPASPGLTLLSFPLSLVSLPILALQPRCPKLCGFLRRCCSFQLGCSQLSHPRFCL